MESESKKYEQKPGTGSAFKNTDKIKSTHPDYKGSYTSHDGRMYWFSAWIHEPKDPNKPKYFTFQMDEKKDYEI